MSHSRRLAWLVLLAFTTLVPATFTIAANGPTPYPDWKNESAWPGKGPIKVFGWMTDNRKAFWSQRERDQKSVVFVGDSLTAGWKADHMAKSFPNLKIANRGIGGDVSRGVLFRFKEDVLDLKPTAIVLCIGTNDLSSHGDPKLVEGNIAAIIAQAREYSPTVPILLCTIPPRDVKDAPTKPGAHADLNARITKLGAGKEHLAVVDLFTPMADKDGKPIEALFAKDHIHINPAGYDKWAEIIRPAMEKLGVK